MAFNEHHVGLVCVGEEAHLVAAKRPGIEEAVAERHKVAPHVDGAHVSFYNKRAQAKGTCHDDSMRVDKTDGV